MVRTKLPNGGIERGNANQRHFARAVQQMDGVSVICSHTSGKVDIAVGEEASLPAVMDAVEEWSGNPSFDVLDDCFHYATDRVAIQVRF